MQRNEKVHVPLKLPEESAKALSGSRVQIPSAALQHFPQTLAAAVPIHILTLNPASGRDLRK